MDLFPNFFDSPGAIIAYIIAVVIVVLPLIVGLTLCWRNRSLTLTAKIAWTCAFVIGGLLTVILYFATNSGRKPVSVSSAHADSQTDTK